MPKKKLETQHNARETISVRDPLYGFVELNPVEIKLLETSLMQRLTRIKQLGHTSIVYPSAVHTRFEHSLGVLHIASRTCDRLQVPKEEKIAIRSAALLHDLGHGPFSHIFERVLGECTDGEWSHEDVTCLMIERTPSISEALGRGKKKVLEILKGDRFGIDRDIVSGPLDADKLDYLRRDSYHTGVAYGVFDIERVLYSICKIQTKERDYLGLTEKGQDAIESYRLARYLMHANVYEHHARLIADDMFLRAIHIAVQQNDIEKDSLNPNKDEERFLDFYEGLDDHSIEHLLLKKSKGRAKTIIQKVRDRDLFKRAYMTKLSADSIRDYAKRSEILNMERDQVTKKEEEIASRVGISSDDVIVHLQNIKIKLYERFQSLKPTEDESPILIRRGDGSIGSLEEESPIRSVLENINRLYVFAPEDSEKEVHDAAEDIFGVPSLFDPKRLKR